jgi:hypothetical protein
MLVPDIGLRTHWYSEERELYSAEPIAEVIAEYDAEEQDAKIHK